MNALALPPAAQTFDLNVGVKHLPTVDRFVDVGFVAGKPPCVTIRRESGGVPCGSISVYPADMPVLGEALRAARRGERGLVGQIQLPFGSLAFLALGDGALSIGLRNIDGSHKGRASVLSGPELERLAEAHCIATRYGEAP